MKKVACPLFPAFLSIIFYCFGHASLVRQSTLADWRNWKSVNWRVFVQTLFNADDFTNTESWTIDTIYVPGNTWSPGCDLTCATSLNFYIYANSSGVPAGYPDGGLGGSGTPIWSLSVSPLDSRVTLSTGVGAFQTNVTLSLTTPINLSPGTYWFVFYPEMSFSGCSQYGSHVSDTTNGYQGKVINPGDGFGIGATSWMDMTTFHSVPSLTQTDWAFRLEGTVGGGANMGAIYLLLLGD